MKNKIIWLYFATLIILAFAYNFLTKNQEMGQKNDVLLIKLEEKSPKTLKMGEITLNIEMADTEAKRVRGLSGREGLAENEGMLFVFEKEGYYGFWMKDMKFAIDMAWLDKDKKIIYIEKNVSPSTYPKVFNSPFPSLYVLETSAEFLSKNNIKNGDFVAF